MTKVLALLALVVLTWMALRRARDVFLSTPRGQELRAIWRLLRQLGDAAAGGAPAGRGATAGRGAAGTTSRGAAPPGAGGRTTTSDASPIALVRCSTCGTHVPEASARRRASAVYCSEACEHRAAS